MRKLQKMSETTIDVRVSSRRIVAEGVVEIALSSVDDAPLPRFAAGAHIDVHLPCGLVRPYSLCGQPGRPGPYLISVLHEEAGRGGSDAMHRLQTGDHIAIGRPRNLFAIAEGATDIVLIAGGIGITPILAMAHRLAETATPFALHYAARSSRHMAYAEELREWFGDRVNLYAPDGPHSQRLEIAQAIGLPGHGRQIYACGPTRLTDCLATVSRAAGWAPAALHFERFAGHVDGNGSRFIVMAARSGIRATVREGETIAGALAQAGLAVPLSCEQGVCGTCLCRVLSGVPDHRDLYLTDAERAAGDQILPCCSRALTPEIVLDI